MGGHYSRWLQWPKEQISKPFLEGLCLQYSHKTTNDGADGWLKCPATTGST